MSRPVKYTNADDLLANCIVKDDCFIWPKSSADMPILGPGSPITKAFGTVSVARILFTICRFVPAAPRLVRHCNNVYCVNPFHYSEARRWTTKRAKQANPHGLLPEQERIRHLIAPPDEVLYEMRPKHPTHVRVLMDSASLAGFNSKGIVNKRSFTLPEARPHKFAEPGKPVLVIKPKLNLDEAAKALEEIKASKKPEPDDQGEYPTDEEDDFDNIFGLIKRRDELLAQQATQAQKPEQEG